MVFDEQRYVREVLEPARVAGNQPPDDLRVRYALVEPLSSPEVAEAVRRVRMCWRKARGQLRFRRLVDRLEGDHLKLAPLFERAALGDLSALRDELGTAAEKADRRRTDLRHRILDAAGEMKMLAPADLREIGGEAAELAGAAGIEIRDPDVLPPRRRTPAIRGPATRSTRSAPVTCVSSSPARRGPAASWSGPVTCGPRSRG